jgi:hypothetical protein
VADAKEGEMSSNQAQWTDQATAEQLLVDRSVTADAVGPVTTVLRAATAPAHPEELARQGMASTAFVNAAQPPQYPHPETVHAQSTLAKILIVKAAIILAAMGSTGVVLAAGTNGQAYEAQMREIPGKALNSPAFTALITAAGGTDKVPTYCDTLTTTRPSGKTKRPPNPDRPRTRNARRRFTDRPADPAEPVPRSGQPCPRCRTPQRRHTANQGRLTGRSGFGRETPTRPPEPTPTPLPGPPHTEIREPDPHGGR